ncbi:60S ribosomal protein L10 [Corchorus olitorius]|uniref:60S ribosomal protein L10 n=1 Tax=Corchorus olitorius TaxID=93759 RepID=A0A1R3I296_9ROSI|nr:60S ribosomal protein L10 [Corchorus olitorius]
MAASNLKGLVGVVLMLWAFGMVVDLLPPASALDGCSDVDEMMQECFKQDHITPTCCQKLSELKGSSNFGYCVHAVNYERSYVSWLVLDQALNLISSDVCVNYDTTQVHVRLNFNWYKSLIG